MVKRGDRVWYWAPAFAAKVEGGIVPVPAMRLRGHVDRMYRRRRMARVCVQGPGTRATFFTVVPVIDLTLRRPERRR